jgi:signal transduction histidine kinase
MKFTSKGYVKLRIRSLDDLKSRIFFEIIDTGIGISADRMPRIFNLFE